MVSHTGGCSGSTLTLQEIYLAVQSRFVKTAGGNQIAFGELPKGYGGKVVLPAHIRHMYDLLSEIAQNAVKHSGQTRTRLRFWMREYAGNSLLIASNICPEGKHEEIEITGHPYETLHDSLFGEGNTGCKKIAYLTASIMRTPLTTRVRRRSKSFHVAIPLDRA